MTPDSASEQLEGSRVPWWRRSRDEDAYREAKRRLEWPMLVLALIFTVVLVVGEVGELDRAARTAIGAVNLTIWAAFAAEYLWLLRLAPDRARFVRTHVLDLIIVLLPVLRPLRALRILRVLRLLRVVAVAGRFWKHIIGVMRHRGLGGILIIVLSLVLIGGLIAYALEPDSFPSIGDAIWWVLVTSTTVGYGDFTPVGAGARVVAVVIMVLGVGLVGYFTAIIVDFLTSQTTGENDSDQEAEPTCPRCAATSERLERIEAQLAELVALQTTPGRGTSGGTAASEPRDDVPDRRDR